MKFISQRCRALTQNKVQCSRYQIGGKYCFQHGGTRAENTLPYELIFKIALDIGYPDIIEWCQTSTEFRTICQDTHYWVDLLKRDFDLKVKKLEQAKKEYLRKYHEIIENPKTVYVGNLPEEITTKNLEDNFGKYGKIEFIIRKPSYAYLIFEDARDAKDAFRALSSKYSKKGYLIGLAISHQRKLKQLKLKQLKLEKSQVVSQISGEKNTLIIFGTPKEISHQKLENDFGRFGRIESIIKQDDFISITFHDPRDALDAYYAMKDIYHNRGYIISFIQ